jgi:predicted GNAT family acetyltransferase
MSEPDAPNAIRHNAAAARFEADIEGALAVSQYRREGDLLWLTHTEVPWQAQGRGLAADLVRATLDWARAEGLKVRPLCSYVAAYMRRHPETQDLLAPGGR